MEQEATSAFSLIPRLEVGKEQSKGTTNIIRVPSFREGGPSSLMKAFPFSKKTKIAPSSLQSQHHITQPNTTVNHHHLHSPSIPLCIITTSINHHHHPHSSPLSSKRLQSPIMITQNQSQE